MGFSQADRRQQIEDRLTQVTDLFKILKTELVKGDQDESGDAYFWALGISRTLIGTLLEVDREMHQLSAHHIEDVRRLNTG